MKITQLGILSVTLILGLLSLEIILEHNHVLMGPMWNILRDGLEASLAGALADWYAITVLFHPAPIPFRFLWPFSAHQEIIVKNREKIKNNIIDLIQNEWLSSKSIKYYFEKISPLEMVESYWNDLTYKREIIQNIREILIMIIDQVDFKWIISRSHQKMIQRWVQSPNINEKLIHVVSNILEQIQFEQVWNIWVSRFYKLISEPAVKQKIVMYIKKTLRDYSKSNIHRFMFSVMDLLRLFRYDEFVDDILEKTYQSLMDSKKNKHFGYSQVEKYFQRLKEKVKSLDPTLMKKESKLVSKIFLLIRNDEKFGLEFLKFKRNILELIRNEAFFDHGIENGFNQMLLYVRQDTKKEKRVDNFFKKMIPALVKKSHNLIQKIIETGLSQEVLSNSELIEQLEVKVLNDMRWILLNGALMGGLVGLIAGWINYVFH
jgi:uncharacterized membrane-anchored protein YjiN (DUF445 family)